MIRNSQIIFAAFTRNGVELALKISSVTGGQVYAPARFNAGIIEPDSVNGTVYQKNKNATKIEELFEKIGERENV